MLTIFCCVWIIKIITRGILQGISAVGGARVWMGVRLYRGDLDGGEERERKGGRRRREEAQRHSKRDTEEARGNVKAIII